MILKLNTVAAFITVINLFSCAGKDNNDYIDKSVIPTAAEKKAAEAEVPNTVNNQPISTQPVNMQPVNNTINPAVNSVTQNVQPNVVQVNQPEVQKTAPGMNPPHGQPNHRCDISVGAPLNSPPGKTATTPTNVTTQQSPTTINTQQVQQTVTAPGMNPPHGQPNHRCDIAVGAPLNSAPGVNAAPTQKIVTPVNMTPAKTDSTKN